MSTTTTPQAPSEPSPGEELMRAFVPESPFVAHLGAELVETADGYARVRASFRPALATIAQTVHGGVLALIDTAAMAAAWSGAELPEHPRGSTVGLSVSYLAPADGEDVAATARVARRGRRLCTVTVDVHTPSGVHVATGLVTYQLG
jgi:uncharacterized protein (TIGR00369 family)